ncbi:citryl-CoA lyase [Acidimangrovimonas pyrenivorans]|uniref:citrate synthase (unknown stereospecificity) n=1 Tax=Acidimangrovimonas pyrenivorans TaxID=2030798 RepID=A0ABV7ADL4_9RHOB
MTDPATDPLADARAWWRTAIIDMEPDHIRLRGYPIEQLIGAVTFPQMIWLMTRGELPSRSQADLLQAALVASVDHGPQAPSIAIARMAMTCGIGLNNAMASAVNVLGDVHGGAGQQAMELYAAVLDIADGGAIETAAQAEVSVRLARKQIVPGFGHRFHRVDPRATRLARLIDGAVAAGTVDGRALAAARAVEAALRARKGKPVPMNIDGITAAVYAELGFSPLQGRGLFILSRAVGVMAHACEQAGQGGRIKGPMPVSVPYAYDGPAERPVPGGQS